MNAETARERTVWCEYNENEYILPLEFNYVRLVGCIEERKRPKIRQMIVETGQDIHKILLVKWDAHNILMISSLF